MVETRSEPDVTRAARTIRACTCCGSTRLVWWSDYRCEDPLFAARVHPSLDLLRCESCGLVQVDHAHLDGDELRRWQDSSTAKPAGLSRRARAWLEVRGRGLAELSRRFHAGARVERIFQYGAGAGMDLVALQLVHRSAECWADRLDNDAAWRSLAQVGDLTSGPFERVLMTHVLGHVHDPVAFVRRTIQSIRPGGLLIVEVGNDLDQAIDRRRVFEPQLSFFTIRTLRKLFATNFGDELEEVYAATAGPRVGEPDASADAPGLWSRWFGGGARVEIDLSDDPGAEDRALARVVLRRRGAAEELEEGDA